MVGNGRINRLAGAEDVFMKLGLGAFTSPLVSTQFAQMTRWSFHYLISLGLVLCNTIIVACVFRFRDLNRKSCVVFLFP